MEISFDNYSVSPIQEKDAWRLCDFVVVNSERLKNYFPKTLSENLTPTLASLFVDKKIKQFTLKEEYLFTIKENTSRTIIGLVYVKELQKRERQGELAYCIGYQFEGKGLMTKTINEMIKWSFDKAQLNCLQIIVHPTNMASLKVAEKNGFEYKGVLKNEHKMADGTIADMLLYELEKSHQ